MNFCACAIYNKTIKINAELHSKLKLMSGPNSKRSENSGGDDTIETYALGNLPGQTLEDNFWLDTYRDELGINVVYDWIVKGDDEYSQKINITIATGELPDIMSVTATQMVQLAEADLIADISDVYEAYAADFTKETLTQEGDDPFLGYLARESSAIQ